jgi:ribose 5-phosphate isomerase A
MDSKRAAGRYAADLVDDGQAIGLGTGSTVAFALERLAERIQHEGLRIACVATSKDTEHKGASTRHPPLHPRGRAASVGHRRRCRRGRSGPHPHQGGGGALVREKIVAAASQELIVIVSESKMVETLGKAFLLPVEFLPFAQPLVQARLQELGLTPYCGRARMTSPSLPTTATRSSTAPAMESRTPKRSRPRSTSSPACSTMVSSSAWQGAS